MKAKLIPAYLAIIISSHVFSQGSPLIPYRKGDLWGFSDTAGNIKIAPRYARVNFFDYADSTAGVFQKSSINDELLMGLINNAGKEIFKPVYKFVEEVPNANEKYQVAERVFGSRFLQAYYSNKLKEKDPVKDSLLLLFKSFPYQAANNTGKRAIFDRKGKPLTAFIYDGISYFSASKQEVILKVKQGEKFGLINTKGKITAPLDYYDIDEYRDYDVKTGEFVYKIVFTKTKPAAGEGGEVGMVEAPPEKQYDESPGVAIVFNQGKGFGVYSSNSRTFVLEPVYDTLYWSKGFSRKRNLVAKQKSGWGLLKETSPGQFEERIPCIYRKLDFLTSRYLSEDIEEYLACDESNKWGIITSQKEIKIPFVYDSISKVAGNYGRFANTEMLKGKQDGKWVIIDYRNNQYSSFHQDVNTIYFMNQAQTKWFLTVQENDRWGVVDEKGNPYVPCQFSEEPFIPWNIEHGAIIINEKEMKGLFFPGHPSKTIPPRFVIGNSPDRVYNLKSGPLAIYVISENENKWFYAGSNGVIFYSPGK